MFSSSYKMFNQLVNCQIALWNSCDSWAKQHTGLPLSRIEVLRTVQSIADCRVNDIAESLLITIGAASKLVDRLQESGHIQRRLNPSDNRSSIVSLTEDGLAILQLATQGIEQLLIHSFNKVDQHQLVKILTQINHNVHSRLG